MLRTTLPLIVLAAIAGFSTGCATRIGQHLSYGVIGDCGCGIEPGCAVEPGCGCEPSCGCEPTCGCGSSCGIGCGRSYAGQVWKGCGPCEGPKICVCKGPNCCASEPGCGCEPTCGCEPSCGCEPTCGCELGGGCGSCCDNGGGGPLWGLRYAARSILKPLCGCGGCGGELYWSEWHNDPPACCDPCDRCGNFIGPSYGGNYGHGGYESGYSIGHQMHEQHVAQQPQSTPMPVSRR